MFRTARYALVVIAETRLGRQLDKMDADRAAGLPVDLGRYRYINAEWECACDARLDLDDETEAMA